MDYYKLKLFLDVVDNLSISKAALQNYTSKQSVSRTMESLETEIGLQLFNRTKNRIYVTEIGYQLYEHIKLIVGAYDDLYLLCRNLKTQQKVTMISSILPSLIYDLTLILGDNIVDSLNTFSSIKNWTELYTLLKDKKIDAFIDYERPEYIKDPKLKKVLLGEELVYIYVNKNSEWNKSKSLNLSDINSETFVIIDSNRCWVDDFCLNNSISLNVLQKSPLAFFEFFKNNKYPTINAYLKRNISASLNSHLIPINDYIPQKLYLWWENDTSDIKKIIKAIQFAK